MIKKGVLQVNGVARCGRGYGRTYAPTMSQTEYAAAQAVNATPDMAVSERLLGVVAALVDKQGIDKKTIAELEQMLEGCGFEVINIGIDVTCDKFVEAVKENHADILCMSALLTTTMTYMKEVIQALEEAGIRNQVKVMIGGAPVSQGFADEIGADGYSDNANTAVAVAKELIGNKK